MGTLWDEVERFVDEYELRADNGDYTPTAHEKILMLDCIAWLLDDDEFEAAYRKSRGLICPR